jgi:hypothetical protein
MVRAFAFALRSALTTAFLLLLGACDLSQAACPQSPAATAEALVKLFVSNTLSPDTAGSLLGTDQSASRVGQYWQLTSPTCPLKIVMPERVGEAPLPEAEMHLPLESGLLLRQLQERFGPGEGVFSSKTSSMLFRVTGESGTPVLVFARLFTSVAKPESPVLALVLRRGTDKP